MPELCKQVIVIRRGDIRMGMGKTAAQAAHASMAALLGERGAAIRHGPAGPELNLALDEEKFAWLSGAFRKICVFVRSEAELLEIHRKAEDAGLSCALIQDNGDTQFNGVPTYTALAIGPHADARINAITGHLPLL